MNHLKKYAAVIVFTTIASISLWAVANTLDGEIKHTVIDLPPYEIKELTAVDSTAGGKL